MPVTNFPDALSLLLELVALHKRSLSTDNDGTWTTPDEQVRETFPALMHRLEVEFDDAQTELFAARDYVEDLIVSVGAITKTTKALLDADLAHDDGVAALVLNDPVVDNNGLYQKEGASGAGSWVLLRSAPITTEQAARIAADAAIDARLTPVSARAKALPKNPRGYLHALVDPSGYVGWALMPDGRPVAALNVGDKSAASQARVLPLPNNPNGYAYVICDADGNVGMAILADGTLAQADGGEEQVSVEPEARPTAYVASGVLRYVEWSP